MPIKIIPIENRFWKYVHKTETCWIWTGAKAGNGYGVTSKHIDGIKRQVYAHRVSYELDNGPIPKGLYVLHSCDNPSCINPKHLYTGTQLDNMRDCLHKGRTAKGHYLPQSKLKEKDVVNIRSIRENTNLTYRQIGLIFNVDAQSIWNIVNRKSWKHIK